MRDEVAGPDESELSEVIGLALEDAAYDCMSLLAGVDTHDLDLRDHPEAWAAVEAFAAKVRADERERIKARLLGMNDAAAGRHNYYAHAAWVLFDRKA